MRVDGTPTTVNVTKEQSDFLNGQKRAFNFSAFVRNELDKYMKLVDNSELVDSIKKDEKAYKSAIDVYGEAQVIDDGEEFVPHVIDMEKLKEAIRDSICYCNTAPCSEISQEVDEEFLLERIAKIAIKFKETNE